MCLRWRSAWTRTSASCTATLSWCCKEERKRRQENIQLTLQVNSMRKERAAGMRRAVGRDRKEEEKAGEWQWQWWQAAAGRGGEGGAGAQRGDERKRVMQQEEIAYQEEIIRQLTEEIRAGRGEDRTSNAAEAQQQRRDSSSEQQEECRKKFSSRSIPAAIRQSVLSQQQLEA